MTTNFQEDARMSLTFRSTGYMIQITEAAGLDNVGSRLDTVRQHKHEMHKTFPSSTNMEDKHCKIGER